MPAHGARVLGAKPLVDASRVEVMVARELCGDCSGVEVLHADGASGILLELFLAELDGRKALNCTLICWSPRDRGSVEEFVSDVVQVHLVDKVHRRMNWTVNTS